MKLKLFILFAIISLPALNYKAQVNDYPLIQDPSSAGMNVPKGWILTGTNAKDYETGISNSDSYSGTSSAYLKSSSPKPVGYSTLLQEVKADNYRGERVQLSIYVKSKLISDWSAVWMKVEDQFRRILAFDNMQNRLIKGSSEWQKQEIVLDVPFNAEFITFGATLSGKGEILIDEIKILVVNKETPLTDMMIYNEKNVYPVNSGFEE